MDRASLPITTNDTRQRSGERSIPPVGRGVGEPTPGQRLDDAEHICSAMSSVLIVAARLFARQRRAAAPFLGVQDHGLLIEADDWLRWIMAACVETQDVFHAFH